MPQAATEQPYNRPDRRHDRKPFLSRLMKQLDVQLMVWPSIIIIFVFAYIPCTEFLPRSWTTTCLREPGFSIIRG